jgi:hypothetical protein
MHGLVACCQVEMDKRLPPQSHRGKVELLILSVFSVVRKNEGNGWWVRYDRKRVIKKAPGRTQRP